MAEIRTTISEAGGVARSAYRATDSWVETLARFGYAAKGIVYILVGGLAFGAAIGSGRTTGSTGALASISDSTGGRIVLAVVAIGLVGYVLWSLIRAIRNPEHDGAAKRGYTGLTAILYSMVAFAAARLALNGRGGNGQGSGDTADRGSATLMQQPFGQWLLGAAGAGIALFGLQQIVKAWRVDLDDQLSLGSRSANARRWAVRAGRLGLAARGVVFAIMGGYVIAAALQSDPSEARGLAGVLDMLEQTPWLLAVVGLGLAAYGVYNLVLARYRAIQA